MEEIIAQLLKDIHPPQIWPDLCKVRGKSEQ